MRILITGKNAKKIEPLVKKFGFKTVTAEPDVIISFGGDGTLLSSERKYPGVPKLPIRDNLICNKCPNHKPETLLKNLMENKLKLQKYTKLQTSIVGQTIHALNDFVIRNTSPIHTIRFWVTITSNHPTFDAKPANNNKLLIGDGIIVATSFGSTGYFQSITRQTFSSGFGLAFNNTTEQKSPEFFDKKDTVIFKLIRGSATLSFDNNSQIIPIAEGLEISFKNSDQKAKIYEAKSLRCPNCKIIRG